MKSYRVISTSIPANESLSSIVDLGDATHIAIECPETLTPTTISFQSKAKVTEGQLNGDNLEDLDNVYDDNGTEFTVTVAPNRMVGLRKDQASVLAALRYVRIRTGTASSPENINPGVEFRFIVK